MTYKQLVEKWEVQLLHWKNSSNNLTLTEEYRSKALFYASSISAFLIDLKDMDKQEEVSLWISIDEQFPEDKYPVLCSSSIYGKVVLCWDELSQTWNYPESNEFYCDWDKVDCWMLIPEV